MSHRSHYRSANSKSTTWMVVGIVAVMLIAVGVLIALSPPSAQSQKKLTTDSALTTPDSDYDFGTISMAQGKVTKTFEIKNTTLASITARKLYTSCMCTSVTLVLDGRRIGPFGMEGHGGPIPTISEELSPEQVAEIEVTFDPAAHGPAGVGPIDRNVFLETTDGKQLVFGIHARVTP